MKETKKENKESQNSILFVSVFESRSRVQKKKRKRKLVFYKETVSTILKKLFYKRIDLFLDNIPETLIIQNLYNILDIKIM